ncbi:MAG: hypothetical protein AB8B99_19585 [Phormidesmis sp.]
MAGIKSIDLKISNSSAPRAVATVTINFSPKEQQLGLEYMLWVTLYDRDLGYDEQWLYPNFPHMPSDNWALKSKDDFIFHMPGKRIKSTRPEVVITIASPLSQIANGADPLPAVKRAYNDDKDDNTIELYARAIVIPETTYAVKYSPVEPVHLSQVSIPT